MMKGFCECRRVQFEVDGAIEDFSHCHCSQCRRLHGAAFATFAGVEKANFRYLSGEDEITHYASSAGHDRTFCRVCGSNIHVALDAEPESLYLSMSTLEGDPPRPSGYHIYVGSKAPWHEILDELPRHDEDAP
jgi:hypothetical protein